MVVVVVVGVVDDWGLLGKQSDRWWMVDDDE